MAEQTIDLRQQRWQEDADRARLPKSMRANRPNNSSKLNSQASCISMARAELRNQRRLNDESPRPDWASENLIIPSVQMPKSNDDDDTQWLDNDDTNDGHQRPNDTVAPDQSVTGRAHMTKRKDHASMCEREMVELRRLVASDDRFGFALERTSQAVYECIAVGNPAPVLALLASLVWRSLCIAWELEPTQKVAKTHLRSKIAGLEGEQRNMVENLDDCRARYLRELVVLRDQIRKRDGHQLAAVHKTVFDEEPVIYYEALSYLNEPTKTHVAEIVEEKLKQLVATLQDMPYEPPIRKNTVELKEEEEEEPEPPPPKKAFVKHVPEKDPGIEKALHEAQESSRRATKELAESQSRADDLQKTVDALQAKLSAFDVDLHSVMSAAHQEFEDMTPALEAHGGMSLKAPPDVQPSIQHSTTAPAVCSHVHSDEFAHGVKKRSMYLVEMLGVERHIRKALEARLAEARTALAKVPEKVVEKKAPAVVIQSAPVKVSTNNTAAMAAAAAAASKAASEREAEFQEAMSALKKDCAKAEGRAKTAEKEKTEQQAELKETKALLEEESKARLAKDKELETALKKMKDMDDENDKLRALMEELSHEGGGKSSEKLKSIGLCWRKPTRKVFDRLYQDSVDRHERHRNLLLSLEQARDEQALDMFRSSMLPFSSYEMSGVLGSTDDTTSFGPGVVRSQGTGWLVDHSPESLQSLRPVLSTEESHPHSSPAGAEMSAAARSPSPSPLNGIPFPFPRTSSPQRSLSPGAELEVEGRYMGPQSRSNSPDEAAVRANRMAEQAGEQLGMSGFAAALGLTAKKSPSDWQVHAAEQWQPPPRPRSPRAKGSRPSSANSAVALHKAKSTIVARPRSAALPAIQKVQRPATEASMLKEAQRLLAAPSNPTGQFGKSASAPGLRGGSASKGMPRKA